MIKLLSTKKISESLKSEFLYDFKVDEVEVIQPFPIEVSEIIQFQNWIFTSVNGVEFAQKNYDLNSQKHPQIFVVGQKTKEVLEAKGFQVFCVEETSELLCKQMNPTKNYTFFCGTNRLDTIPTYLQNHIQVLELYEIKKSYPTVNETYDGYLFFSPSGVDSLLKNNQIPANSTTFAIGKTTAMALGKYSQNILIPNRFNIKALLQLVKETYD